MIKVGDLVRTNFDRRSYWGTYVVLAIVPKSNFQSGATLRVRATQGSCAPPEYLQDDLDAAWFYPVNYSLL